MEFKKILTDINGKEGDEINIEIPQRRSLKIKKLRRDLIKRYLNLIKIK